MSALVEIARSLHRIALAEERRNVLLEEYNTASLANQARMEATQKAAQEEALAELHRVLDARKEWEER